MKAEIYREAIEAIVGDYCDGTFASFRGELIFSIREATFLESESPQELADRMVRLVEQVIKDAGAGERRVMDATYWQQRAELWERLAKVGGDDILIAWMDESVTKLLKRMEDEMMIYEQLAWYSPRTKPLPEQLCSVLVKVDGVVYSGVWSPARGDVTRFPEDLPNVTPGEIELWAAMPSGE